jgi:hypothetical protein
MLGAKTSEFIMDLAEGVLSNGKSVCVESAFYSEFTKPYLEQISKNISGVEIVEVYCHTNSKLLKERFIQRVHSGERHPGHNDLARLDDSNLQDRYLPINFGRLIRVDTTNFENIDYKQLISDLK